MLYVSKEWQSLTGAWHCNCVDDLGNNSGAWWHPARILGITPAQFISLLLDKYKPDYFYCNKETGFCNWSWKNQTKMRLYKNMINAAARKINYQI